MINTVDLEVEFNFCTVHPSTLDLIRALDERELLYIDPRNVDSNESHAVAASFGYGGCMPLILRLKDTK